jgi:hypothetical protein
VVDLDSDEGSQRTGYLAETKDEYCSAIKTVRQEVLEVPVATHACIRMCASLLAACHVAVLHGARVATRSAPADVSHMAAGSAQHESYMQVGVAASLAASIHAARGIAGGKYWH